MNGQTSLDDVLAAFFLAVSLFAASLIPFFLFVDSDLADFDPRRLQIVRDTALTVAALLMILSPSPEAVR